MILAKESVEKLSPYVSGNHTQELFDQGARAIKLDSNEATISPSPRVVAALSDFVHAQPLNWYPDVHSTQLIAKLAEYTELPTDCIQTFSGSDHALETLCRTYLTRDDEVVLCMPTYDHFRLYAASCEANLIPVYGPTPFIPKPELLLQAVTPKTKIIYLVNPNNPTGSFYSEPQILSLLEKAPHALLLVDEAYFEFSKQTVAHLVKRYPNLAITRSFSKAFGLAGLRCGYLLTQACNLAAINKIRNGKNINSLAQTAALAALHDLEYTDRYVTEVHAAKKWLCDHLKSLGVPVIVTPANFLMIQVAKPKEVLTFLAQHHIFIRDRSELPQLEGFLRVTVGHLHIMERFWRVFRQITLQSLIAPKKQKNLG